jgi:hypothetical protein
VHYLCLRISEMIHNFKFNMWLRIIMRITRRIYSWNNANSLITYISDSRTRNMILNHSSSRIKAILVQFFWSEWNEDSKKLNEKDFSVILLSLHSAENSVWRLLMIWLCFEVTFRVKYVVFGGFVMEGEKLMNMISVCFWMSMSVCVKF